MYQPTPDKIRTIKNAAVLMFLSGQSAHSDIAEVLYRTASQLSDVDLYSSDIQRYGYCVATTSSLVFAYAHGMSAIGVRLAKGDAQAACSAGGCVPDVAETGWVEFEFFRPNRDNPDIASWISLAYKAAEFDSI